MHVDVETGTNIATVFLFGVKLYPGSRLRDRPWEPRGKWPDCMFWVIIVAADVAGGLGWCCEASGATSAPFPGNAGDQGLVGDCLTVRNSLGRPLT